MKCEDCKGSGEYRGLMKVESCAKCNGSGVTNTHRPDIVRSPKLGEKTMFSHSKKNTGEYAGFYGVISYVSTQGDLLEVCFPISPFDYRYCDVYVGDIEWDSVENLWKIHKPKSTSYSRDRVNFLP